MKSENRVRGLYKFIQAWSVQGTIVFALVIFRDHHSYAVSEQKMPSKLQILIRKLPEENTV